VASIPKIYGQIKMKEVVGVPQGSAIPTARFFIFVGRSRRRKMEDWEIIKYY